MGPKRAELYESGKLTLDQMVTPDKQFVRTLEDLGVKKETPESPKIETTEEKVERIKSEIGTKYQAFNPQDYNEIDEECGRIADDFIKGKTETEIWTAKKYTLYGDQAVNAFIRDLDSDPSKIKKKSKATKANQEYIKGVAGIDDIVKYKQDLTDLFDKYKTDRNYITYRGVNDNNMLGGTVPPVGKEVTIDGFSSSSISARVGYNFSKTHPPIVYRILIPKGSSVLPLCGKNGDTTLTHLTSEKELLLKNKARVLCIESKTADAKEIGLSGKGKIELITLLLIDGNER
ncbi:hypothetical protein FACS189427_07180 [Planctomycetales bacterium]|nr:hypothetical protein FACS189427_07180 [Planctomycetales bacterium]